MSLLKATHQPQSRHLGPTIHDKETMQPLGHHPQWLANITQAGKPVRANTHPALFTVAVLTPPPSEPPQKEMKDQKQQTIEATERQPLIDETPNQLSTGKKAGLGLAGLFIHGACAVTGYAAIRQDESSSGTMMTMLLLLITLALVFDVTLCCTLRCGC